MKVSTNASALIKNNRIFNNRFRGIETASGTTVVTEDNKVFGNRDLFRARVWNDEYLNFSRALWTALSDVNERTDIWIIPSFLSQPDIRNAFLKAIPNLIAVSFWDENFVPLDY